MKLFRNYTIEGFTCWVILPSCHISCIYRSVEVGPVSLSRCSCCEVRSPSSWTSSSPTPRRTNLCPSAAFSSQIHLCLGPLSKDWQEQWGGGCFSCRKAVSVRSQNWRHHILCSEALFYCDRTWKYAFPFSAVFEICIHLINVGHIWYTELVSTLEFRQFGNQ